MIARYSRPEMASVFSEKNKLAAWTKVETAAMAALVDDGVVPESALKALENAPPVDPVAVAEREAEIHHDLAAFVDVLGASAPECAAWLHWGLTSSDVVDTGNALIIREAGEILSNELQRAVEAVRARMTEHADTRMLGRTHGMPAEVISFGGKLSTWVHELERNATRIAAALEDMRVGKLSGAVGTYSGVSSKVERSAMDELGLEVEVGATQIVQRDRYAHLLCTLALCASSLERFATEVRHLQRAEVGEVSEPFAVGQKGSSAMPHKRNPIISERICGLARVIRGNASVALQNIPLWHERDISHSSAERVIIGDSFLLLHYILGKFIW